MIFYLIAFAALCCWKMKVSGFREGYLGKEQTDALKGIFAMLIFFSHLRAHIALESQGDILYSAVFTRLGQMTVVPFFFYSGYGVIQGIKNKPGYAKGFLKNRVLKYLVGYNIVTLTLGVIYFCIGMTYPPENYILAWSGYLTPYGLTGSGAWYIFVLLVLYLITAAIFFVFRKMQQSSGRKFERTVCLAVFLLSLAFMAVLYAMGKEEYWYNTILAYPFGIFYGILQNSIDRRMKKLWVWILVIAAVCVAAGLILISGFKDAISYSVMGFLFVLVITFVTMRVRIQNPILQWIGGLSFGVYILQRSFMILFEHFGLDQNPVVFTAVCLAATLVAAVLHQKLSGKINLLLFTSRKKQRV